MAFSVRISRDGFEELINAIEDTQPLFQAIGQMADRRLQDTQSAGQDPYGRTWEPLATGEPSFLRQTGDLENSRNWEAGQGYARIGFGAHYAKFHQTGTSKMPRRRLVPDRGLPGDWDQEISDLAEEWANAI
jgi:phage virion morphogenesis protein